MVKRCLLVAFALLAVGLLLPAYIVRGQTAGPGTATDTGTEGAGVGSYGNVERPFGAAREAPTFSPPVSGPVPFATGSPPEPDRPGSFPGPTGSGFPGMDTRTGGSAGIGTGTDSTFGGSGTGSFGLDKESAGAAGMGRPGGTDGEYGTTPDAAMSDGRLSPAGPPSRFPSVPGSVPFGGSMGGMSSGGAGALGGSSAGFPGGDATGTFGTGLGGIKGGPGGGQR